MKKLLFLCAATLACSSQASEYEYFPEDCDSGCECSDLVTSLEIGTGYRRDSLKWGYPGFSPGIAIHEKWDGIDIGFIEANSRVLACQKYLLKVDFDYGWSGWENKHHVKLIDYNSAIETKRPESNTKAEVYDISVGIGHQFNLECYPLTFTPLIGWSYNHQKFKAKTFYGRGHHDSRYAWNSGWVGFETAYQFCCPWQVYLDYSFHIGHFHAKIDEFFRNRHKQTYSLGNEVEVGTVYQWCDALFLGLKFNYRDYWAHSKHSTEDAFDGKGHERQTKWNSYSIGVNLGYSF